MKTDIFLLQVDVLLKSTETEKSILILFLPFKNMVLYDYFEVTDNILNREIEWV
jgi:hypothetical protein